MKFFLCVIGMVLIIEGLPYFAFPEKLKTYFQKISDSCSFISAEIEECY